MGDGGSGASGSRAANVLNRLSKQANYPNKPMLGAKPSVNKHGEPQVKIFVREQNAKTKKMRTRSYTVSGKSVSDVQKISAQNRNRSGIVLRKRGVKYRTSGFVKITKREEAQLVRAYKQAQTMAAKRGKKSAIKVSSPSSRGKRSLQTNTKTSIPTATPSTTPKTRSKKGGSKKGKKKSK